MLAPEIAGGMTRAKPENAERCERNWHLTSNAQRRSDHASRSNSGHILLL